MNKTKSILSRAALTLFAGLGVSAIVVACTEDMPVTAPGSSTSGKSFDRSSAVAVLSCQANVEARTVECAPPTGGSPSSASTDKPSIILGGQDQFVSVKSSNVFYNPGTGAFTFNVTVRNLIPQPLGTADGTTLDVNGVRVFFKSGPTVTDGTGSITVTGDGSTDFDGTGNKPYYQYNTVLDQFDVSSPKTWQLNIPNTVNTFSFLLLVSAKVPFENGYIDMQVSSLRPPLDRQITYTVRNANGTVDPNPGTITWGTSDPSKATVDANGVVNPLRAGPVTFTATAGSKTGTLTVNVLPIRRYWLGASNTNYETGTNWYPDNIVPGSTDTIVVTDTTSASNFPTLAQNESVGGIEIFDLTPGGVIPSLNLAAFNMDASGDVATTFNGSITNSSGVLILSGIGRTVGGTMPFLRVTGTYSLNANVTARAPLRVDLGRLTNSLFRVQVTGF